MLVSGDLGWFKQRCIVRRSSSPRPVSEHDVSGDWWLAQPRSIVLVIGFMEGFFRERIEACVLDNRGRLGWIDVNALSEVS